MSTNFEKLRMCSEKQLGVFIRSIISKEASQYVDWSAWLSSEDPDAPYIGEPAVILEDGEETSCMVLEETEQDGYPYRTFYQILAKGNIRKETVPNYMIRLDAEEEYPPFYEIEPEAVEEIPLESAITNEEYVPRHAAKETVEEEPLPIEDEIPAVVETEEPVEITQEEAPETTTQDIVDDLLLEELSNAIHEAEANEDTITMRLKKIDEEEALLAEEAAAFSLEVAEEDLIENNIEEEPVPEIEEDSQPVEIEEEIPAIEEDEIQIDVEETATDEPEVTDDEVLELPTAAVKENTVDQSDTFTAPLLMDLPPEEDDIDNLAAIVEELTGKFETIDENFQPEEDDEDEEDGHIIGELLSKLKQESELFDPNDPEDLELPTIAFTAMVDD